ncbi:MAG: hypothetical protein KDD64_02095 [Bdellovibrionales bacterium]|nr:hypothetical protein [Bdellovibrionales bacterium]
MKRKLSSRLLTIFFCLGVLLDQESSLAITIDTFQGTQTVVAQAPGGSNGVNLSTQFALGGNRSIFVEAITGSGTTTVRTTPTSPYRLQHSQDFDVIGRSLIHWDGNNNVSTINPAGLGGVDLTEDGSTAFILKSLSYDFPSSQPLTLTLTAYDASDATGQTFSAVELTLNSALFQQDQVLPFASFTLSGSNGPVDFANLGALSLEIDGTAQAADLEIDSIITNGFCNLIPTSLGVIDECGECLQPTDPLYNQSCADCVGVPNGSTLPGSACETIFPGICSDGQYDDQCDCLPIQNPQIELCDGIDNDCDGAIDETFPLLGEVCGAGEEECAIEGVYICSDNGGLTCDADFDLSKGQDCDDRIGCDGIPGSTLVQDQCGICGGDGSTCADCDSRDISETQFALDGGAKYQERLIITMTRKMLRARSRAKLEAYVEDTLDTAHTLQISNWVLSWTLPTITSTCPASEFCIETSNVEILDNYRAGSVALRDLGLSVAKKFQRIVRASDKTKRFRKRIRRAHKKNMKLADTVPTTQSVCSGDADLR